MGFFSWECADTGEVIRNRHTGEHKNVYMLLPNGGGHIVEYAYDGYGIFGGTSAYVWLARINEPELTKKMSEDEAYELGVKLTFGCHKDVNTSHLWSHGYFPNAKQHDRYDQVIEEYGMSPNELINKGIWIEHIPELKYPLKFSFSDAVYENLPASKEAKCQGFF
jgi:hypothetical protein